MNSKPPACKSCALCGTSYGFTRDLVPPDPKVFVLRRQPMKEEINAGEIILKDYWEELFGGFTRDEIGAASMIRCGYDAKKIPVAMMKIINTCRVHDDALEQFNANAYVITYDIMDSFQVPAYKTFIRRAFELSKTLVAHDFRPVVLMGPEVAKAINPHLFADTGNERGTTFKDWVGHWWTGEWPFEKRKNKLVREILSA